MQIILAIGLAVLAIALFVSRRFILIEALERAAYVAGIVAALAALLMLALYTTSPGSGSNPSKPIGSTTASNGIEYVGRVIDIDTQIPVNGAKVTLDVTGVPAIVYTDSEGVFRFIVPSSPNLSGQIRVEASGYRVYTRNITMNPETRNIEDIRLSH